MVCFYVFIGFWILFVFRSDLYCIEFFIPFEIEVEVVLKSLQRMLNAIVAIELTGVALGAFDVFVDTNFYTETFFKSFHQFAERFVLEVVDAVFHNSVSKVRITDCLNSPSLNCARYPGLSIALFSPDDIFTEPSMSETMKSFSLSVEVT